MFVYIFVYVGSTLCDSKHDGVEILKLLRERNNVPYKNLGVINTYAFGHIYITSLTMFQTEIWSGTILLCSDRMMARPLN